MKTMNCITVHSALFAAVLGIAAIVAPLRAQIVAPVEEHRFGRLTSYADLQDFLKRIDDGRRISVERIAVSQQGRSISLVRLAGKGSFGSDTTKVRVLLFAQQHGDEPSGKEAMTLLLAKAASGKLDELLKHIDLMIVPQMNPDGAESGQRRTSDNLDLNRNHFLLTSPATKALHDVFYRWLPQVTVDIHEFSSFSSEWSDSGFIKSGDVQLGMLTNLNTAAPIRMLQHELIYPFIATRMNNTGYSFHEYIVGSPRMYVRHSTTEINDGRQSFGILGAVSFIQEGRKWKSLTDQLERRSRSQLASIEALLDFCSAHAHQIQEVVGEDCRGLPVLSGHPIALRMDHVAGTNEMHIPVHRVKDGFDTTWCVHPYLGEVRVTGSVSLPQKYLIERKDSAIAALLYRHHVKIDTVRSETTVQASSYRIDSVGQTILEEDTLPRIAVTRQQVTATLNPGDFVVSTAQRQSRLLGIALEPESIWGIVKYDQFAGIRQAQWYPIKSIP